MSWFKTEKPKIKDPSQHLSPEHSASIEIVAHQNAHAEAKKKVDEANEKLKKLFQDNHFTLKIYLATGGQIKQKQRNK